MYWVETIVCSGRQGVQARLQRLLRVRQEFKRRQSGCVAAWVGSSPENEDMLLVQSIYQSQAEWKAISEMIQTTFDTEDGGIESLLLGPPLVGLFQVEPGDFPVSP